MNLDKIQSQIDTLQRCVDNVKLAEANIKHLESVYITYYDVNSYFEDMKEANEQLASCEDTLKTQLRINQIVNQEILK
jgi:hypothetical protein